jgi:hypothetical protein
MSSGNDAPSGRGASPAIEPMFSTTPMRRTADAPDAADEATRRANDA